MGGMWSRCWWVTWVSGFFGIAGLVHVARAVVFPQLRIVLGQAEVPPHVSLLVGIVFLVVSGGLLALEAYRERTKRGR